MNLATTFATRKPTGQPYYAASMATVYRGGLAVYPPNGFGYSPGFGIYRGLERTFAHGFDFDAARPFTDAQADGVYYVDVATGNDTTGDGSTGAPFKSLYKAVNARTGKIIVRAKAGTYNSPTTSTGESFRNADTTAITHLICEPWGTGRVASTIRRTSALSFTKTAGKTNVYQVAVATTITSVTDAGTQIALTYDKAGLSYTTASSIDTMLYLKASIDEVDATPGSWYWTGGTLYIHALDSASPSTTNTKIYIGTFNLKVNAGTTLWIRDFDFEGGDSGICGSSSTTPFTIYAKNCSAKYCGGTTRGNGFKLGGPGAIVLQNCLAAGTMCDGFNYTDTTLSSSTAVELNCAGMYNGYDAADTSLNASSIHEGYAIVRVSGDYKESQNRNIHDVGDGSQSWILGCSAGGARALDGEQYNYRCGGTFTTTTTSMWLDTCDSSDNTLDVDAQTDSTIYTYKLVSGGNVEGDIFPYTP